MTSANQLATTPKGLDTASTYIVGRRSWIAQHLFEELRRQGRNSQYLEKSEVGTQDLRLRTLYLIAGVARPTREDMDREIELCTRARKTGARVIYLSSAAVDRWEHSTPTLSPQGELYVLGKKRCESIVTGGPSGCGYVLRAPVVFGPNQRLDSDMLLPTIVRSVRDSVPIELHEPLRPFEMVYVRDLVELMVSHPWQAGPPVISLRTAPTVTPIELCALAAPGHPVVLKTGWVPYVPGPTDRKQIKYVGRIDRMFRHEDVVRTVEWYDDQDEEPRPLLPPGTKLLER